MHIIECYQTMRISKLLQHEQHRSIFTVFCMYVYSSIKYKSEKQENHEHKFGGDKLERQLWMVVGRSIEDDVMLLATF